MQINYLAVFAAAVASFAVGAVWFTVLFGKLWAAEMKFGPDHRPGNMGMVFGLTFVLALIAAYVFAMFLGPEGTWQTGLLYGFAAGAGWVATSLATDSLFAKRSLTLFLIDAGHHIVRFSVIGLILGAWH